MGFSMRISIDLWRKSKEYFWKRVHEDLEIGYLDRDLLPLLILVNLDAELYTTSSCSGRIVVMDSDTPWQRDETNIVFKSHVPVESSEVEFIYRLEPHRGFWMIVTGPIIHVSALKLKRAVEILNVARRVGFKHSGIMHVSPSKGVFVELVTGVYVSQLVRVGSKLLVPRQELQSLVEVMNKVLVEGKSRLQKLYTELVKILPRVLDREVNEKVLELYAGLSGKTPLDIFLELCREKNRVCEI
ncbi:MAG: hypothetical protein QW081_02245 [Desulfurococcaceae archaeon]